MLFDFALTRSLAAMYITHFTPIGSSVVSMKDKKQTSQKALHSFRSFFYSELGDVYTLGNMYYDSGSYKINTLTN